MYLYKLERTDRWGHDEYDSMVVCAKDVEDALSVSIENKGNWYYRDGQIPCVTLIGIAAKDMERSVIVASFNAG